VYLVLLPLQAEAYLVLHLAAAADLQDQVAAVEGTIDK